MSYYRKSCFDMFGSVLLLRRFFVFHIYGIWLSLKLVISLQILFCWNVLAARLLKMEWGLLSTELWWFLYPLHEYKISFEAHEVSCVQVSFINLLHKFLFAFLFVAPKQILWCQLENLSALNSWKVMIFWAYFYTCQTIFESKVWTFFLND